MATNHDCMCSASNQIQSLMDTTLLNLIETAQFQNTSGLNVSQDHLLQLLNATRIKDLIDMAGLNSSMLVNYLINNQNESLINMFNMNFNATISNGLVDILTGLNQFINQNLINFISTTDILQSLINNSDSSGFIQLLISSLNNLLVPGNSGIDLTNLLGQIINQNLPFINNIRSSLIENNNTNNLTFVILYDQLLSSSNSNHSIMTNLLVDLISQNPLIQSYLMNLNDTTDLAGLIQLLASSTNTTDILKQYIKPIVDYIKYFLENPNQMIQLLISSLNSTDFKSYLPNLPRMFNLEQLINQNLLNLNPNEILQPIIANVQNILMNNNATSLNGFVQQLISSLNNANMEAQLNQFISQNPLIQSDLAGLIQVLASSMNTTNILNYLEQYISQNLMRFLQPIVDYIKNLLENPNELIQLLISSLNINETYFFNNSNASQSILNDYNALNFTDILVYLDQYINQNLTSFLSILEPILMNNNLGISTELIQLLISSDTLAYLNQLIQQNLMSLLSSLDIIVQNLVGNLANSNELQLAISYLNMPVSYLLEYFCTCQNNNFSTSTVPWNDFTNSNNPQMVSILSQLFLNTSNINYLASNQLVNKLTV